MLVLHSLVCQTYHNTISERWISVYAACIYMCNEAFTLCLLYIISREGTDNVVRHE